MENPLLRQAVLDLFQANRDFTATFRDGGSLDAAARRLDDARERVWSAQQLAEREP